ncbi:hypothetical protein B0T13DRAFT_459286 [Neurospora crassa]|nr:hypothetical protein B0T13DRAFT_459286 [Neurospora crassa]
MASEKTKLKLESTARRLCCQALFSHNPTSFAPSCPCIKVYVSTVKARGERRGVWIFRPHMGHGITETRPNEILHYYSKKSPQKQARGAENDENSLRRCSTTASHNHLPGTSGISHLSQFQFVQQPESIRYRYLHPTDPFLPAKWKCITRSRCKMRGVQCVKLSISHLTRESTCHRTQLPPSVKLFVSLHGSVTANQQSISFASQPVPWFYRNLTFRLKAGVSNNCAFRSTRQ